jgi:2-dehydro-3-deoxygluconokinase
MSDAMTNKNPQTTADSVNPEFWAAGECMLELQPDPDGRLRHAAAGDTFNTAVYLKRLLPALPVRYVSALGDDAMSGLIRAHMRADDIDDSLVATLPGKVAGLYAIETDASGERRFCYWRMQSAARAMLSPEHLAQLEASFPACRYLLLTGISLAILDDERRAALLDLAARVRARGGWVVLDSNYRPALWDAATARHWLGAATEVCSHALLSFDDEAALYGDRDPSQTLARALESGAAEVVVKLGAEGCLVGGAGAAPRLLAAQRVDAVDTTAAGDSFNAGYLAARMRDLAPDAAAAFAAALAATVVGRRGAIIPADAMPATPWAVEQ